MVVGGRGAAAPDGPRPGSSCDGLCDRALRPLTIPSRGAEKIGTAPDPNLDPPREGRTNLGETLREKTAEMAILSIGPPPAPSRTWQRQVTSIASRKRPRPRPRTNPCQVGIRGLFVLSTPYVPKQDDVSRKTAMQLLRRGAWPRDQVRPAYILMDRRRQLLALVRRWTIPPALRIRCVTRIPPPADRTNAFQIRRLQLDRIVRPVPDRD